jgi:hypothetical protein
VGTLSEYQALATNLSGAQFVQQVGPVVLLRYPANGPPPRFDERQRTEALSRSARAKGAAEVRFDLSQFQVVTLPPPSAQGLLLRVGRHSANDLILEDPSASKEHALLQYEGGQARLTDLDSMNGTSVNGQALKAQVATPLRDGDAIAFGDVRFMYYTSAKLYEMLSGLRAR